MPAAPFVFSLLLVLGFSFATWLEPWFQAWAGSRTQSANILSVALGDSRKLFARHFYLKADAYFHSGYYPTIYDNGPPSDQLHMAAGAGAGQEKREEENANFLGKPKDWLDAFSRNFFPSRHRHLGEEDHEDHAGEADHQDRENAAGQEREMLPWLRLAATLDPDRPETYLVASFWMRTRLGKVNEAEQFLREGLRANPGDCELTFELGRIYLENRQDSERARNLWELALGHWQAKEPAQKESSTFIYAQILGNLAKLETEQKNFARAIDYLNSLKVVSPNKDHLQKWIDELKAKQAP
jgi:tetratricopeptide (TPR) repeat protein